MTTALPTEPKSQDRNGIKITIFIHFFSIMGPFFVGTEQQFPNEHLNRPLELT